jgi:hypothetical protein
MVVTNDRADAIAVRTRNADAPWRRMLPPVKPYRQLPRRGADDTAAGNTTPLC